MPAAVAKRPPSAAKLQERDITRQVRDFLQVRGWRAIRMQRSVAPGSFSTGEPGMADFLFVRYFPREKIPYGAVLHLWVEFKAPTGRVGPHQKEWQKREAEFGGSVWVVDDLEWFQTEYFSHYGWLHSGDSARGQLDLLGALRA